MISWPWRRSTPDHEPFLREIAAFHPGKQYQKLDRYRDFRQVFLKDEQGRRVLYEILNQCGIYLNAASRAEFDPYKAMFLNGQQDMAYRLLSTINIEPKERPKSTREI